MKTSDKGSHKSEEEVRDGEKRRIINKGADKKFQTGRDARLGTSVPEGNERVYHLRDIWVESQKEQEQFQGEYSQSEQEKRLDTKIRKIERDIRATDKNANKVIDELEKRKKQIEFKPIEDIVKEATREAADFERQFTGNLSSTRDHPIILPQKRSLKQEFTDKADKADKADEHTNKKIKADKAEQHPDLIAGKEITKQNTRGNENTMDEKTIDRLYNEFLVARAKVTKERGSSSNDNLINYGGLNEEHFEALRQRRIAIDAKNAKIVKNAEYVINFDE